jgi:hypothetical protein
MNHTSAQVCVLCVGINMYLFSGQSCWLGWVGVGVGVEVEVRVRVRVRVYRAFQHLLHMQKPE